MYDPVWAPTELIVSSVMNGPVLSHVSSQPHPINGITVAQTPNRPEWASWEPGWLANPKTSECCSLSVSSHMQLRFGFLCCGSEGFYLKGVKVQPNVRAQQKCQVL